MTSKSAVKQYGIYNRQLCEFVLVRGRYTENSSTEEYDVRPLTNAEIMKRLNERPAAPADGSEATNS